MDVQRPNRLVRVLRLTAAAAVSATVCLLVNRAQGGPLDVRTDTIGYPTFADFNFYRNSDIYRLLVFGFPLGLLGAYWLLGWLPLFRVTRSARRQVLETIARPSEMGRPWTLGWVTVRLALTGVALGLELAVVLDRGSVLLQTVAVATLFVGLIVASVRAYIWWTASTRDILEVTAQASALTTVLPLLGLYGVSRRTELLVTSTGVRTEYEWLPALLVLIVAASCLAVIQLAISRALRAPDRLVRLLAVERSSVLYVSCGVLIFLFLANLPGTLGPLDAFHEGEALGAVTSLRAGELPWRDSVGLHGLLGDYLQPLVGLSVFEDTRWGQTAGLAAILFPLVWVTAWWSWVRFMGRSWLMLVLAGSLLVFGSRYVSFTTSVFGFPHLRFILQPIILITLAATFIRRSRGLAVGVGALVGLQFILSPESAYTVVAMGVTLVLYDLFERRPNEPWTKSFSTTTWAAVGALAILAPFTLWLVVVGGLDEYVDYFRTFAFGHELTGTLPVQWGTDYVRLFWIVLAPLVAVPFAAYVLIRRWRHQVAPEDWAMFFVAIFSLLYYRKFLARPDDGHLLQVTATSSILVLYATARLFEVAWTHLLRPLTTYWRAARSLSSLAIVALALVFVVRSPWPAIRTLPDRYRAEVAASALPDRLGYSVPPANDPTLVDDVGALLLGADLGEQDLFDFTNGPALFYYVLPFESPTRYPHVQLAVRKKTQEDLISELASTRPKVVAFDSDRLGLPSWDGVANQVRHYEVSAWLFDNYRPWVSLHGYVFLQRADLTLPVPGDFGPESGRQVGQNGILFSTRACDWGSTPSFLDWTPPSGPGHPLAGTAVNQLVTVSGWAARSSDGAPPARIAITTADGEEVGSAQPTAPRPDVAALVGGSTAAPYGFQLSVGLAPTEDPSSLRVLIEDDSGAAVDSAALAPQATSAGRYSLGIDALITEPIVAESVTRVALPPDAATSFDWLVLDGSGSTPVPGIYEVSDVASFDEGHLVTWRSLERSPSTQAVPLASCAQWHAYGRVAYIRVPPLSSSSDLRLVG